MDDSTHCPLCLSADVDFFDAYAYQWWTCMKCGWMRGKMKPDPRPHADPLTLATKDQNTRSARL